MRSAGVSKEAYEKEGHKILNGKACRIRLGIVDGPHGKILKVVDFLI